VNRAIPGTASGDGLLLRTVVVFAFTLLGLETAAVMLIGTPAMGQLCDATAAAAGTLARLTGAQVAVVGVRISTPARDLLVIPECAGVYLFALLGALTVASPVGWSSRLRGLGLGILAIVCANLLRLVLVIHIAGIDGSVFALLHDYLFQAGMLLVVLGAWFVWLKRAGDDAPG
jgi:exosortase/archaeosortase family protein